jgi:hypothetical protein
VIDVLGIAAGLTRDEGQYGPHTYRAGPQAYPGVTAVIGQTLRMPQLERWRGRVGNEMADTRRDEAAAFGTQVHAACELVMEGVEDIPIEVEARFLAAVDAYQEWHQKNVAQVLGVELPVVNATYQYGGTIDLYAILVGEEFPATIDLKTSAGIYAGHHMQTAAYQACDRIDRRGRRLIVHLDKGHPGRLKVVESHDFEQDFGAFQSCLYLYRYLRSRPS